jgi:hypothetical protein
VAQAVSASREGEFVLALQCNAMPTIHIIGGVLPTGVDLTIGSLPTAAHLFREVGLKVNLTFSIVNSAIDVRCDVNRYSLDELGHILKIAHDLTRTVVNFYNFATGNGLTIVFEAVIDPNGNRSTLLPQDLRLAPLCTAYSLEPTDPRRVEVLMLMLQEPPLFRSLNDLIDAITHPHAVLVNCARVIERLTNAISPPNTNRKQKWAYFRDNLRLGQEYLEYITGHSTGPRHGKPTFVDGTIGSEVSRRSWIVMNRFLEFRRRGNQPLPESEFPLLVS